MLRAEVREQGPWQLKELRTSSVTGEPSHATVVLTHEDGEERERQADGDGPVEAAFRAIEAAAAVDVTLCSFDIRNVTLGEDAQGDVALAINYEGAEYHGSGLSTDVVEASARAFVQAVNRALTGADRVATTGIVEKLVRKAPALS